MQLPEQLINELSQIHGFDKEEFLAAHTNSAPTSIRLNPQKHNVNWLDAPQVQWCATGRYLPERPVFTLDPAYHAGAYYVQEASSMFLQMALNAAGIDRPGLRVLDLCAAPGGKTTLTASSMHETSLLVANEVIRSRASILEENVLRWGYPNTWVTSNDPRDLGKLNGYFDIIIVDAPCSGSGLWRKDPKALNEWSDANVTLCALRQQRILDDIWPALKTGGTLIYATCSFSAKEDEDILEYAYQHLNATSIRLSPLPHWGITEVVTMGDMYGYRFFPGKVLGEGFFLGMLQKQDATEALKPIRFKSQADKKIKAASAHLLVSDQYTALATKDEGYCALLPEHEYDKQVLEQFVYLRRIGVQIGQPTAKEWVPAHDVALSLWRNKEIPTIELQKEQALKYLKREDTTIDPSGKGWNIVTYQGNGLGWAKLLGNRVNNYIPKNWRIRMELE